MMETLRGAIVSYAVDYIGQEEIKGNMGFKDEEFDAKMREVGFNDSWAWCVLFCELCWKEAYNDFDKKTIVIIDREFTAGAVRTYRRFKEMGWTSQMPEEGDMVIWQTHKNGVGQSSGHAAIVIEVHDDHFLTVEGNTNDKGGREGYIVAQKKRKYNWNTDNGLRLLGFVKPK